MNVKLIKSKSFDKNEVKGTIHTVAYNGVVFNVSSLDFEEGELEVKDNVLSINTKVEIHKDFYEDAFGNQVVGRKLKPFMDIPISILSA